MSTGKNMIRQVKSMAGDNSGRLISDELIIDLINEEVPRILARFPKETSITITQESTDPAYLITSTDSSYDLRRMKIMKVFLEGSEAELMRSDEMERITKS